MAQRQVRPYVNISSFAGIYSKNNPELLDPSQLREGENLDLFKIYGAASKLRGNKKIGGRLVASNDDVSWIGFYKSPDLDGQTLRHVLTQRGDGIYRLETGGTFTNLDIESPISNDEPNGLFRTSDMFGRYLLVTGQDPEKRGNSGTSFKYDGDDITPWGVTDPGSVILSTLESFDSAPTMTAGSNTTITTETNVALKSNSVKMTHSTSTTIASMSRTISSTSFNTTIADRIALNVYLDRTSYSRLTGTNRALSVYFGSDVTGASDYYRFDHLKGSLVEGWNLLLFDFTLAPSGSSGTSVGSFNTSAVQYLKFETIAESATSPVTSYWDDLVQYAVGTPTATTSGGTTLETFESTTGWSATNGSVAVDSVNVIEGTNSLKLTKTSTAATDASMDKSISIAVEASALKTFITFYIPPGDLQLLDGTDRAVSIYIGSNGDFADHYFRFDFTRNNLSEGFNTKKLDFTQAPESGNPDIDNLNIIRCEFITSDITFLPSISFDQLAKVGTTGIFPSSAASTWKYKVTYINKEGAESNAGPASAGVTNNTGVDLDQITLSNIPVSTAKDVIARKLYRTTAGGEAYLFLATINNNTTTGYSDIIPDGSLGVTQPPVTGDTLFDNSPPPKAGIVKTWKRTVFMAGDPINPNILYYSRDDLPEAFPLSNGFELDNKITGIFEAYLGLIVTTQTAWWRVLGDNPNYTVDKIIDGIGCVGQRSAGQARLTGWAVDRDGVRFYDLRDTLKASEPIRDKYDNLNKQNIERIHTCHSRAKNSYIQFNPNSSGNYTSIFLYQYTLDDIRQGWWSEIKPPSSLNFLCCAEIEDENGDFHLYAGGDDGQIYEIMADDQDNWVDVDDNITSIDFKLATPYIRLGDIVRQGEQSEEGTTRVRPRFMELHVEEASGLGSAWTLQVLGANGPGDSGAAIEDQSYTFTFNAGETMKRRSLGSSFRSTEWLKFIVTNTEKDKNLSLLGIRIYYDTFAGPRPI